MPQHPATFQQTVWNPILDPTTINRGASTSIIALLLDFKNGIYQQTRTRTNLLAYSQNLTNAIWVGSTAGAATAPTTTVNYSAAPDGSTTATRVVMALTGATNGDTSSLSQTLGATGNTFSIWLKTNDASTKVLTLLVGSTTANATVTGAWQRFQVYNSTGSTVATLRAYGGAMGAVTADLSAWGAQLEAAPAASAYIPTTSAPVSVTESITDPTPVRTNFVPWSNDLTNANWTKNAGVTVSNTSGVAAPSGNVLGQVTTSTSNDVYSGGGSFAKGQPLTASATIFAGTSPWVRLSINDNVSANYTRFWFNPTTGAAGSTSSGGTNPIQIFGFKVTSLGGGFYRIAATVLFNGANAPTVVFSSATADTSNTYYTGGTFYVGEVQIEQGYTATAYIPTQANPVTVGAVTDLYGYTYSRSGAKEEVGTTYGPELVTNGTFDTNTNGWYPSAGAIASVNGEMVVTGSGGSYPSGQYPLTLVVGKTYLLTATGRVGTANGNALVRFGSSNSTVALNNSSTTNATGTYLFTATQTSDNVTCILLNAAGTGTVIFDNISVKEVIPASSFAANVPAIIPGTGYFARPAYTNLVTYSQDFTNAAWAKNAATIGTGVIAPDGSSTANSIVDTTFAGLHQISENLTIANATAYTASYFLKSGTITWAYVGYYDGTQDHSAYVNLSTGTLGTLLNATATITSVGNGWYRVAVTGTSTNTAAQAFIGLATGDGGRSYTGAGTGTIYIWQAQVVQASDPGPIIVTTSATAAVGADALIGGNITLPAGDFTLVAIGTAPAPDAIYKTLLQIGTSAADYTDCIELGVSNSPRINVINATTTVLDTANGTGTALYNITVTGGAELRLGVVRSAGVIKPYIGGALATGPAYTSTAPTIVRVGQRNNSPAAPYNGPIQRIVFAPYAMTAAQIAAL